MQQQERNSVSLRGHSGDSGRIQRWGSAWLHRVGQPGSFRAFSVSPSIVILGTDVQKVKCVCVGVKKKMLGYKSRVPVSKSLLIQLNNT